jgi:hypothetical protein
MPPKDLEIMDHCSSKTGKIDYFLFVQRKLSKVGIDAVSLETGKYKRIPRVESNLISQ